MIKAVNFNGQFKIGGSKEQIKETLKQIEDQNTKQKVSTYFVQTLDKSRVLDYVEGIVVTEKADQEPIYKTIDVLKSLKENAFDTIRGAFRK